MFRTAFPFGYLLQFLALGGAAVLALGLVAAGVLRRRRGALRAGLGLAGALAAVLAVAAAQPGVDQWNPYPVAPRALVGRWVEGDTLLELRPDSSFRVGLASRPRVALAAGAWSLFDWNLTLRDTVAGGAQRWRVVAAGGEYRVIRQPGDPDTWDGRLGFRHVPSAPAPPCTVACD